MFKIIKKGSGNFWHNFNNGSKEVNLSDWEIVLDSVSQTVSLQMLNGANVPINSVFISDILIIDETDGSVEETFVSVEALRIRLVELNYTPYIVLNGFVPEAPIDGLTYGRKDAEWVEVSGGGSVGTLQQVTDNGNTTTNAIEVSNHIKASEFRSSADDITFADGSGNPIFFFASTGANQANFSKQYLTSDRNYEYPDNSGTIALASDITTPNLQAVTDGGGNNRTTNEIISTVGLSIESTASTGKVQRIIPASGLANDQNFNIPNTPGGGTIALTSDIPTVDATPTDGSSNAVSSNGVFDGLALKQDLAVARTGAVIAFDALAVYNSFSSPTASNITDSLGTAKIGIVQKIYSNKATEPTYPAGWVNLSGTYTNSVTNIIYCEWCEGSRVEYWIVEA